MFTLTYIFICVEISICKHSEGLDGERRIMYKSCQIDFDVNATHGKVQSIDFKIFDARDQEIEDLSLLIFCSDSSIDNLVCRVHHLNSPRHTYFSVDARNIFV